ncbi:putative nicotinate phosphoribosyltransferase [Pseudomonas phage phiK7A1]|uniref:Putative nicotinate phosphoribosyltransferase n=1 Tax=Pseudomonas phage phiK7A1 TaxID=2759194 RepID=A0A7H0XFM7_9CAUD|nr:putative nicotinate phosphoribosyltransferase [Pseudomonas phage phiK7A1]
MIRDILIPDPTEHKYPTVNLTKVLFLAGEFQIEQGPRGVEYNPYHVNDVISISGEQAVALANAILKFAEEEV